MNAETTVGGVRKASGWSMLWAILMFVCGILAISLPLASSIGLARLGSRHLGLQNPEIRPSTNAGWLREVDVYMKGGKF
jgi:hypothetical protein